MKQEHEHRRYPRRSDGEAEPAHRAGGEHERPRTRLLYPVRSRSSSARKRFLWPRRKKRSAQEQ